MKRRRAEGVKRKRVEGVKRKRAEEDEGWKCCEEVHFTIQWKLSMRTLRKLKRF